MRADTQPYSASRPNVLACVGAIAFVMFLVLANSTAAWSQTGGATNPDDKSTKKVKGPSGEDITEADCAKLKGSTAPIQRLARLPGAMSVRNLEFTYFKKPLYALTAKDFALLRVLKPFCDDTLPEIDELIFNRLEAKVNEASATREKAVQWIAEATAKMDAMKPSPEAIREVHNLWVEMESRRLEMLVSDQNYFSKYLTKRRNALYEGKQVKPRVLISPFAPGPTIAPDQKE